MSKELRKSCQCHNCDEEMNHNAEKLDYTACLDDPKAVDPDLGGVLEEFYTCPHCGSTEVKTAQPGN